MELDPAAVRQGHDPQLEKAVDVVLDLLAKQPPPQYRTPAYPNYHGDDDLGVVKKNGTIGNAPGTPDNRTGERTNVKVPGRAANAGRKRGPKG